MARKPAVKTSKKIQQKKSPPAASPRIAGTQLAAVLSDPPLSERSMRDLTKRGFLAKVGRGEYDLARSVQGYLRFRHETEVSPVRDENIVTSVRLGEILGLGDRWMRELADMGYLVKAGRGAYELAGSVQGYNRFLQEKEAEKREDISSRALFEAERARKLKLENDTREAQLIETQDAIAAIDYICGDLRTSLAGIAPNATDDIVLRRRIDDAIDKILHGIADKYAKAAESLREGRDPLAAEQAFNA